MTETAKLKIMLAGALLWAAFGWLNAQGAGAGWCMKCELQPYIVPMLASIATAGWVALWAMKEPKP